MPPTPPHPILHSGSHLQDAPFPLCCIFPLCLKAPTLCFAMRLELGCFFFLVFFFSPLFFLFLFFSHL